MTYDSVVQELDGLIDSLDEHVTIEDVGVALGELRANVVERAKAEKAHTPTDDEREAHAERIVTRHLSRLAKQSGWAEDDTAIGGQAANIVRQLGEARLLRRSEVPVPNAEVLGEWFTSSHGVAVAAVAPMTDRGPSVMLDGRVISPNDVAALMEFKSQGEPSNAQLLAQGFRDGVDYIDDQPGPWGAAVVTGRAEAARRVAAAGGVR